MELELDELVVTLDASQSSVADLLAASKQAGFPARVVTDAAESTQVEPPPAVVPPTVEVAKPDFFREAVARAGRERKPLVLDFMAACGSTRFPSWWGGCSCSRPPASPCGRWGALP